MACNPSRIEVSNAASTTVQITLASDPGDGSTVILAVPELSITTSGTTAGGVAVLTPIGAVSAATNSIWDATIQVGVNRPAVAEVLITETNTAQTIGVTVTDSTVSYCAPLSGGGGSGTVTSVGLNVPGGFTVAGTNPITASGTFEITSTLSGVIKADGAATFSGGAGLNDLSGVSFSLPLVGKELLQFNGTNWQNASLTATDIPSLTLAKISDAGSAAASSTTDFVAATAVSTFGGTLIDDVDAAAARTTLGLGTAATSASSDFVASSAASVFGLTLLDDADAAAARTTLGLGTLATASTITDSYLMLVETPSDKTYTLDGRVAAARTVTNFYAKTSSGTCTATLKNLTDATTIGTISVTSTGGSAASLTNTGLTANERIAIEISSNSSSADLEMVVEFTQ